MKGYFDVLDAINGDRTVDLEQMQEDISAIFCDLTWNKDKEIVETCIEARTAIKKLITEMDRVERDSD